MEGARGRKLKYSKLNPVEEEDYDEEEEEDKDERNGHSPDAFFCYIFFIVHSIIKVEKSRLIPLL